jgi:hypothetical protein
VGRRVTLTMARLGDLWVWVEKEDSGHNVYVSWEPEKSAHIIARRSFRTMRYH